MARPRRIDKALVAKARQVVSRTADIEQILVRGVHGPGEIYAVIVDQA